MPEASTASPAPHRLPAGATPEWPPSGSWCTRGGGDLIPGFVAAYTAKAEGPSSLLPATLLGKYGQGVEVARRLLDAQTIGRALERSGFNRLTAARELGVHKSTLFRKMRDLGISFPRRRSPSLPHPGK